MRGFTLLEALLVLALLGILAGIGLPAYQSYNAKNHLKNAETTVLASLRRAETLARYQKNDAAFGVYVEEGQVTVFEGDSYAARVSGNDEVFIIASAVSVSGDSEVLFTKREGLPTAAATISLALPAGGSTDVVVGTLGTYTSIYATP